MNVHAGEMPNQLLRLQKMHNGQKVEPTFSSGEMSRRQNAMRRILEELKLDAAVLTSYHNVCYFSDFMYCYFGRKYAFVITDQNATTVSAGIDAGQPYRRTFGDNLTYTDWQRDNYYHALRQLLPDIRRLGIEFDHVAIDLRLQLQAAFPGVEFIDVGAATMWLRTIKSDEEIALIKEGAATADIGGAAVVAAIKEGVPEYEVALAGTQAMVRHIASRFPHAELMDTWVWFQSGTNTDGAHNPVTSRQVEKGDILSLNCFPMIAGYYTALERTLFLDHASEDHLRIWELNCKVHRRGLELLVPGARTAALARSGTAMAI